MRFWVKTVRKPVPEEEIGYLAMHLGAAMERLRPFPGARKRVIVVCSEGVATAWLLVSRLRAELPNIDVDEVMPALEVQKQAAFDKSIDAIISILPLKREDIPVIVVNPLLRMKDVALIRKTLGVAASISVDKEVEFIGSEATSLATLLKEDTVALQADLSEWHRVVELAVGLLVQSNGVEPMYTKAIEDLVINHGPYMVIWPGVALLHGPPKAGVKRLCMSLVTLKDPVVFGHEENDPVDIVFALGAVEGFTHRQALEELNELVNDPVSLHAIRTAESHGQIIQAILRSIQALNG